MDANPNTMDFIDESMELFKAEDAFDMINEVLHSDMLDSFLNEMDLEPAHMYGNMLQMDNTQLDQEPHVKSEHSSPVHIHPIHIKEELQQQQPSLPIYKPDPLMASNYNLPRSSSSRPSSSSNSSRC